MFRFILLLVFLIVAGGAGTWFISGQVNKYSGAQIPGDIRNMLSRASAGDVNAEFRLGEAYRQGAGIVKNIPQAIKWYGRAAEKGHTGAQYKLGLIYETGEGVKKSMVRAAEWYRLSASLGKLPEAQFALGLLYFHGRGVQQDYVEAFNLYKKAAEQGHHVAQHVLGAMYQEGWAVERDLIEAYKWYTLALPGREQAMAVNHIYDPERARRYLVEKMNNFQIGRGQKLAREWRSSR